MPYTITNGSLSLYRTDDKSRRWYADVNATNPFKPEEFTEKFEAEDILDEFVYNHSIYKNVLRVKPIEELK